MTAPASQSSTPDPLQPRRSARADRLARPAASRPPEPARPRGANRSARSRSARARPFSGPTASRRSSRKCREQRRPAEGPARRRRSGARSCRPAWRWNRRSASPCSGPEGTFCEQAAVEYFGGAVDLSSAPASTKSFTPRQPARTVRRRRVENSTEGVVTRSLDLFLHPPLHVRRGQPAVRHHLLRNGNSLDGIEAVPRIRKRSRNARAGFPSICPMRNGGRSRAMPKAQGSPRGNPALAGIAERTRRNMFGLHIVAHAIQDDSYNRTRFASSSARRSPGMPPPRVGTAPVWSSLCPTAPARCTTCWCHSRPITYR